MSANIAELKQQIDLLCIERGLEPDEVMKAIEVAIAAAFRKEFGDKDANYEAVFTPETGKYSVYKTELVVDEVENLGKEVPLMEIRLTNPNMQIGDVIRTQEVIDNEVEFGRIASQVAKQVLFQSINNVRHTKILQQFKDKIGDIVTVEVDCFRKGGYMVKLGQTIGFMSRDHILMIDKFKPGQLIKALIVDITEDERGNSRVILSRTDRNFVTAIISNEVPEVNSGIVVIDKIVREPGSRTKILVSASEDEQVDPVGTILGRKNVRLVNIMREISTTMQEKIDIIENQPNDLEQMMMDSLEPAEIDHVDIDLEERHADVYCYPEEAPLAVGKRGVNIRLASELLEFELNLKIIENEGELEPEIVSQESEDFQPSEDELEMIKKATATNSKEVTEETPDIEDEITESLLEEEEIEVK
jgi:transcription termination/antitermination protein NusA